jgi:hypothetical protein
MSKVFSAHAGVTNFVHVGLVVEDLDEAVRFLALLGFDCGVTVTEDDVLALPFVFELSPELVAELKL